MSAGVYKVEDFKTLLDTVDEEPVGLNVTLATALVLPGECVVAVHSVQFVAFSE